MENMEQNSLIFLQKAFASEQECLITNLKSSDRIVHNGDKGEVNEEYFIFHVPGLKPPPLGGQLLAFVQR